MTTSTPPRVRVANSGRGRVALVVRRHDVGVAPLGPEKKHLLTKFEFTLLLSYGTLSRVAMGS